VNCQAGEEETYGPDRHFKAGAGDAPGSYVFASTTGRAVSP
jgi:hypothetical protein